MGLKDRDSEFFDWYEQLEQYRIDQRLFDEWSIGNGAGVRWPRLVDFVLDLGDGRQIKKTIQDPGNVLQGAPSNLSGTMRRKSDGGYEVVAEWNDTTGFAKAVAKWRQFNLMTDSSW